MCFVTIFAVLRYSFHLKRNENHSASSKNTAKTSRTRIHNHGFHPWLFMLNPYRVSDIRRGL